MGHQDALEDKQGLCSPSQGDDITASAQSGGMWALGSILPKFSSYSQHLPHLLPRPQVQGQAQNRDLGPTSLGTEEWAQPTAGRLSPAASGPGQLLEEEGDSS